jgi:MSHA pilin protein MshC
MFKKSGFTLIELVIVIILIGILAATAIPKFIGNNGFEAQAYRDQLLQLLKTVQQQAMSCDKACRSTRTANPYACNKVLIVAESSTEPSRFGIPTNCDDESSTPLKLPETFNPPQLGMSKAEADSSAIKFSPHTIEFNSRGVASSCAGCDISIFGEQTLSIRIESQGYIHEED